MTLENGEQTAGSGSFQGLLSNPGRFKNKANKLKPRENNQKLSLSYGLEVVKEIHQPAHSRGSLAVPLSMAETLTVGTKAPSQWAAPVNPQIPA